MVDFSFNQPGHGGAAAMMLPADLAVLLAGVAARQATSPTALIQARLEGHSVVSCEGLAVSGAFNAPTARLLNCGGQE